MLTFTGTGSAFNTALGNNSCYVKDNNKLFLIDCGSSTFNSLLRQNVLEGVDDITVFITHLHPDHVGSLGDLIFYTYYVMSPNLQPKINVVTVEHGVIEALLKVMGVSSSLYSITPIEAGDTYSIIPMKLSLLPVKVNHVKEIDTHGLLICYKEEVVYYSADSTHIPGNILRQFKEGKIGRMYQDVSGDPKSTVHMPYDKLREAIPEGERHRVYCMHLDAKFDVEQASNDGFNIA